MWGLMIDDLLLTLLRGIVVDLLHVLGARIWRWRTTHALKKSWELISRDRISYQKLVNKQKFA